MNEITICARCQYDNKEIPMIGTMVFMGAELWCPYCGNSTGIFGERTEVKETQALLNAYEIYYAHARRYLDAMGDLTCTAKEIDGERVERGDFPSGMVENARNIVRQGGHTGKLAKDLNNVLAMKEYLRVILMRLSREFRKKAKYNDLNVEDVERKGTFDITSLEQSIDQFTDYLKQIKRIIKIIARMEK